MACAIIIIWSIKLVAGENYPLKLRATVAGDLVRDLPGIVYVAYIRAKEPSKWTRSVEASAALLLSLALAPSRTLESPRRLAPADAASESSNVTAAAATRACG